MHVQLSPWAPVGTAPACHTATSADCTGPALAQDPAGAPVPTLSQGSSSPGPGLLPCRPPEPCAVGNPGASAPCRLPGVGRGLWEETALG